MTIRLTEAAARRVAQILADQQPPRLRLGVRKSGCSGYAYVVEPATQVNDDDVRGRGISGMVRGPPKLGATPQQIKRGVDMGEFAGFHLNG